MHSCFWFYGAIEMIIRVLIAGILAGVIAGFFYTAAQAVRVAPLIVEAETYENAGDTGVETLENHSHATEAEAKTQHEHDPEAWAPNDGFERTFYSLIANSIVGVAYSLLLVAGIFVTKMPISPKAGLVWGAAGFVVFVLAPGLGLPPEVPGTVAAGVPERQMWWLATVVMTAGGLFMFAFKFQWYWLAVGLVLVVAPHVYGAPQPVHHESLAPANIAVEYVVAAIVTSGLFWLFLGSVLGWMLPRALADNSEPA